MLFAAAYSFLRIEYGKLSFHAFWHPDAHVLVGILQAHPAARRARDETELHESTVSRACSGKYLICPLGVFELKYFFSSSVGPSDSGEAASAAAVKAALKRLVDQEPKAKPLSDAKIASALEQQGFSVARRTVAKYREALGIAPASERKNLD